MIALGRALVGARPRRDAADMEALAGARARPRVWRSRRRPSTRSSPRVPSRSTSTRPSCTRRATRCPLVRELQPDVVVADILTLAPALAAELEACPCATLIPHVYPHGEPRLPDLLARRAPAAQRRRPRALAARAGAVSTGPGARPRRAQRDARARSACAPLDHVHGGISRELALVATFPQLEYPRAWPDDVHVVGPLMWEPPAADVELPPRRRRRSCSSRRRRPRTPSTACSRAALRGLADAARARARDLEPPAAPAAASGPRERACRRLGLLLAHHAPLRRSRLPRRPRHARARARIAAAPSSPARPSAT